MTTPPTSDPGAACPVCGRPVTPGTPRGLCPKCLMAGVLAETEPGGTQGHAPNLDPDPDSNRNPAPPPSRPSAPDLASVRAAFPGLEVFELIGVGGMGAVYRARQRHLDRPVALKILATHLAAQPAFVDRFNREARLLARLNHPNIVTVHDFGQAGGYCFLLMEYIDGVNLRQAMLSCRFTPAQALALVPRLCDALQFAHDEGVLHRDIKPENILLDARGRVKIADFGIAKLVASPGTDRSLTVSGAALGTPAYMAPEQIERPSQVDHRADLYSLGVVFYELLTGELPLGRFAPPSEITPVDRRVDDVVLRALEKEREKRFQSAAEIRTQVEHVAATPAPPAPAPPPAPSSVHDTAPDFLIAPPGLPAIARALVAYGLVIAPALFLLLLPVYRIQPDANPYVAFVEVLTNLCGIGGDLVCLPLMFIACWKIRQLQPSAPAFLRRVLWARLGVGGLVLLGTVWAESLRRDETAAELRFSDSALMVLGIGAVTFELLSLAWLYRHRDTFPAILQRLQSPTSTPTPPAAIPGPPPATAPHATLAAVLTGLSLVLGLPALAGVLLWLAGVIDAPTGAGNAGLGPVELAVAFALGAGVLALAGTAAALGFGARRAMAHSTTPLYGQRRATFSLLVWPLVLASLGCLVLFGRLLTLVSRGELSPNSHYGFLGTLALSVAAIEFLVRLAWRLIRLTHPGQATVRRPPPWLRAMALAATFAALVILVPAASVSFGRANRANSSMPVHVLHGDPAVPAGVEGERDSLQLRLVCARRSILFFRATLLRNGQAHQSPVLEGHLLNTSLETSQHSFLVRLAKPESPESTASNWELVVSAPTGAHTFSHHPAPDSRITWATVGVAPESEFPIAQPLDLEILRGRSPDGTAWSIRLQFESDPLVPAVGVKGAAVGPGRSWATTARALGAQTD